MENRISLGSKKVIFKEGEIATGLYIVKQGEVICLKASKDRLIPVFVAKAGDIIGESAMIDGLNHTYSALSLSNVELVAVPSSNFRDVFGEAPAWLIDLTTTMISRFQNTASLIAENRVISPILMEENQFSSAIEVEFKKLLQTNRIE
jgi:CRP/FNR family cyclic AMP-dependent transcriptional regulator